MTQRKTIGLIPARSGSKGIPNKNLSKIDGISLITRAISSSLKSTSISEVYVSSDESSVLQHSRQMGCKSHARSEFGASDSATASDVLNDFFDGDTHTFDPGDLIIYLQPTSPFRRHEHIDEAVKLLQADGTARSLVSVRDQPVYREKLLELSSSNTVDISESIRWNIQGNRQSLSPLWVPNGAIYIFYLGEFLDSRVFPIQGFIIYKMDAISSLDIDSKSDLAVADKLERMTIETN